MKPSVEEISPTLVWKLRRLESCRKHEIATRQTFFISSGSFAKGKVRGAVIFVVYAIMGGKKNGTDSQGKKRKGIEEVRSKVGEVRRG